MIYQGAAYSYKVSKLSEMTSYNFCLYASNIAGNGPCSEIYTFTTTKAQPPVLKGIHFVLKNSSLTHMHMYVHMHREADTKSCIIL